MLLSSRFNRCVQDDPRSQEEEPADRTNIPQKSSHINPAPFQRRCIHGLREWVNKDRREFFSRHGVPGFLSAETFQETYIQYSQHLIDRLNELTQGTVDEGANTRELHEKYAHRSDKAALYNVSAMLTFTRFFWEQCLTESEDAAARKPGMLTSKSIEHTFSNLETLREEMLDTADAMFGNGFVWLMKGTKTADLKILATYNAGSPFKKAAPRRDDTDMATVNIMNRPGMGTPRAEERDIPTGNTRAGSFGAYSANAPQFFAGVLDMEPVLCLNVWEHQWIKDYGLMGKRAYLAAWWDRIDWQKVENAVSENSHEMEYAGQRPAYSSYGGKSVFDAVRTPEERDEQRRRAYA